MVKTIVLKDFTRYCSSPPVMYYNIMFYGKLSFALINAMCTLKLQKMLPQRVGNRILVWQKIRGTCRRRVYPYDIIVHNDNGGLDLEQY